MGAPRAEALAGGALDDVSNKVVQATLVALTLPFVGAQIDTSQFKSAGPDRRLLAAIGVALVVSGVVVLALPKVRARVLPEIRDGLRGLWNVARDRRKRIEVFGGSAAAELLSALALGATSPTVFTSTSRSSSSSSPRRPFSRAWYPFPEGSEQPRRSSLPDSSRWVSTNRPPSPSPSPSDSAPSICRRSGATSRSGGLPGRVTSETSVLASEDRI